MLKRIATALQSSDVAVSLATAFVLQAAIVVSGVIAARALGIENRGHLALLAVYPFLLTQLGTLGLPMATTYFVARSHSSSRSIVSLLLPLLLKLTAVLIVLHGVILVATLNKTGNTVLLAGLLTLVATPGMVAQMIGLAFLQGLQRFHAFNTLRCLQVVLYAIGTLLVLALGMADLLSIALVWALSVAVSGIVVIAVAWFTIADVTDGGPESLDNKAMLLFGIRSFLGSSNPIETFRIDHLAVSLAAGPSGLGIYVVAQALTNLPKFAAQSIGNVAYPRIVASSAGHKILAKFLAVTGVICGLLTLVLAISSNWAIPFFFGSEFRDAITVSYILLISALLFSLRRILGDGLRGLGKPGLASWAEVISWIGSIPAIVLLLPRGVEGVAWIMVVLPAVNSILLITMILNDNRITERQSRINQSESALATDVI